MQTYDVVIAGSGPSGSSCAKALKDEGLSAVVLEKENLPRYKTCSGVLMGQAQELVRAYFGVDAPDEVFCGNKYIEADDIREWKPERGYLPYVWELDKDGKSFSRTYQNVWRNKFDKWLLDQSGAEYHDGMRLKGFDDSGSTVKVHAQAAARSNKPTILNCRYLVGADGNASTVRRLLGDRNPESGHEIKMASFQSYYKLESFGSLKENSWTVFLKPEIGDIILCVHIKDGYLTMHVGGGDGRNLHESMEKFKGFLSKEFGVCVSEHWRNEGCVNTFHPIFMGDGNVLITGEAAGFMYLNGEGIAAAMDSGYRCGKAIAESLRTGKPAKDLYAESCQDIAVHVEKCISQMHFFA